MSNLQELPARSCELLQTVLAKCGMEDCKYSPSTVILFILAVLCAVLPLTLDQLTCAIVAAVVYALYQEYRGPSKATRKVFDSRRGQELKRPAAVSKPASTVAHTSAAPRHSSSSLASAPLPPSAHPLLEKSAPPGLCSPSVSRSPPPGLSLQCQETTLDQEVDALLGVISPTPASDRMVRELARAVQQNIQPTFPEAQVVGFSSGDLTCSSAQVALGMCVPEVDLVVSIKPASLTSQLSGRLSRTGGASTAKLDARKVQKSAIRACTDRLVNDAGFKFRRSAFKGQEPKITLLAPAALLGRRSMDRNGSLDEAAVPVDLSVNTVTPQCSDAVLRASRKYDARAQALIVLVRRWARDRGICHSAKGHLSPYAWSLLTAFYLQVSPSGDAPFLPALEGLTLGHSGFSLQQAQAKAAPVQWAPTAGGVDYTSSKTAQRKSVITLFREFVLFYHKDFNWRSEAASLHVGRRAAPELSLPLHIVVSSDGVPTQVGPHIQDPFEPKSNLGTSMTPEGFARMQEEFARAVHLLQRSSPEASLAELLEPWVVSASVEAEADGEVPLAFTAAGARQPTR